VKLHIRLGWAARSAVTAGLASVGLASVLLAGCGSAPAPAGGGAAASGSGASAGSGAGRADGGGTTGTGRGGEEAAPCTGQGLAVSVGLAQVGAAAGSSLYPINITNASAHGCRLRGYPAAWLAGASGDRIGPPAAPDQATAPHPVSLPPGGAAHVWLQVGTAADYPASQCQPATSRWLVVRLANGGPARSLHLSLPACAGRLPAPGLLMVKPFEPGRGKAGHAG
jgi:hypothetical protein